MTQLTTLEPGRQILLLPAERSTIGITIAELIRYKTESTLVIDIHGFR